MIVYKMVTFEDLNQIWNADIKKYPDDDRWVKWKEEYINYNKTNKCKTFVILDENKVVGQITIIFSQDCSAVKDRPLVCNGKDVANMNAFRIEKKYEGKSHISKLVKMAEKYAKEKGIKYLTIGCEANKTRNLAIYLHWGYDEFVMSEIDNEEDDALVLYFRKKLLK